MLLAGLAAALASFGLAYLEAKELQDDTLRQIATLADGVVVDSALSTAQLQEPSDKAISDPESHVVVIHLPRDPRPAWLASDLPPGFHTLSVGAERLRVFVRGGRLGERTVVAQPTDARDEIAINSALRTLIPLLLLLPVLAWLIVRIVRSELAPITQLSRTMASPMRSRPSYTPSTDY
jgi:two-component system OmpR family sensor kinase